MAEALEPPFAVTLAAAIEQASRSRSRMPLLIAGDEHLTAADLHRLARFHAQALKAAGIGPGDCVATALGNGPNHAALFIALAMLGAVWAPVSPDARGPSLAHMLAVTRPRRVIATQAAAANLRQAGLTETTPVEIASGWTMPTMPGHIDFEPHPADPDDIRAILFTSGTSGPPKGVQVTERMLAASAAGCGLACACEDGDAFLMWEPMHHIGGPQILLMALAHDVSLIMVERFSASRFWEQVRTHRISKLHYLGGILEILLKAEPSDTDRDHPIRLAFGGGCRRQVWTAFEQRFAIPIREVYGMTEASSFTTVNVNGTVGSVGTPVPWLDAAIVGADGQPVPPGEAGEIVVTARHPGLFTPGYRDAPEATARLLRGGRLHSGDLGRQDSQGNFQFIGRMTDSLRRRGENISAWEVETALSGHPLISETAVVGVEAEIGEHEILCFVRMKDGASFDPPALAAWCRQAMPAHHVPRYWKRVEDFERTPSQRIRKDRLDRDLAGAVDTATPRRP